jgi:hypothetical protein
LIPAEFKNQGASPSFVNNLAKDCIQLVYTTSSAAASARCRRTTSRRASTAPTSSTRRWCCARATGLFYGAFENRGGNPSLGYNYPFQFTLIYNAPNDTAPNRLPDGSLVGLDARDRVVLDPVNVNANGLTLRGVEFDYKTPRLSQLQRDAADRA